MTKSEIKKKLQKERIIKYFIEATVEIIKDEGIDAITIRKVADKAGYNSATIYNYFESLDHLVFLASMRFITPYTKNLGEFVKGNDSTLEKNFIVWKLFLEDSFRIPRIYNAIFFANLNNSMTNYVAEYYDIYPQDLPKADNEIKKILSMQDIYDRTGLLIESCVEEGLILKEDADYLTEMTIFVYKGLLDKALKAEASIKPAEMVDTGMKYIKACYNAFLKH